ncbi:MAG: RDD family protein [Bacteroidota bacterium]|nr:RDD family protein [Bacteroidota bacterium]
MPSIYEMLNSKKTVVIGSGRESDVVFNDPQISPRHCQISKAENGGYLIVDLDSVTGTYINNTRVAKGYAVDSDSIKIGNKVFQITSKIDEQNINYSQQTSDTKPTEFAALSNDNFQNNSKTSNLFNEPNVDSGNQYSSALHNKQKKQVIVYFLAAPEDENSCKAIYKHLSTTRFDSPLPIEMMGDFKITAGEEISVYQQKLSEADIVLAFVSVDFLSNNGCYDRLKTVIANHNNRKTILLPILARNCMWKATPFANLPLLPKNQQPLNNRQYWNSEDDALTNVVDDIYKSINDFTKSSTVATPLQHDITTPELKVNWRGKYFWKVFWKRFAAYLLDVVIIMIPVMTILYLIWGDDFLSEVKETTLTTTIVFYGVLILIWSWFDSSKWRGTPGKRIMKLQITDDIGNPISFQKALVRNVIKYSLLAFADKDNSGVFALVFWIGQILCFIITKKFIHDYFSHTIIGERLNENLPSVSEAKTSMNNLYTKPSNELIKKSYTPQQKLPLTNNRLITSVGVIVVICVGVFFLLKQNSDKPVNNYVTSLSSSQPANELVNTHDTSPLSSPQPSIKEVEITEDQKASLISAIDFANNTEIEAMQSLNPAILERAYTGEILRSSRSQIEDLKARDIMAVNQLDNQEFINFKVSPDGQRAEVKVIQTWSTIFYSISEGQCISKISGEEMPQTLFLKQRDDVWVIYTVVFDKKTEPKFVKCD